MSTFSKYTNFTTGKNRLTGLKIRDFYNYYNIQHYNLACYFVWLRNLVSHPEEGT